MTHSCESVCAAIRNKRHPHFEFQHIQIYSTYFRALGDTSYHAHTCHLVERYHALLHVFVKVQAQNTIYRLPFTPHDNF